MSVFENTKLKCPSCGADVKFSAVHSVNADRRPDLREAILDESFQRRECPSCQQSFRLAPDLNYLDVGRGQWFAAHPLADLARWQEVEQHDREAFDRAFGEQARTAAREIGADLHPRITFGWAGLREKILAARLGLDDVILECAKIAILRSLDSAPLRDDTELRLVDELEDDTLLFVWIELATEAVIESVQVPRALYDDIASNNELWAGLRAELSAGLYVDINRLLVEGAEAGLSPI
jgi:hypothetical protein